jgi:hypothetical protein
MPSLKTLKRMARLYQCDIGQQPDFGLNETMVKAQSKISERAVPGSSPSPAGGASPADCCVGAFECIDGFFEVALRD